MSELNLMAITQYGDLSGDIALDNADSKALNDLLKEKGIREDDEFILGFEAHISPNSLSLSPEEVRLKVYLGGGSGDKVKEIETTIDIISFIKLFKEISFTALNRYRR